MSYQTTPPEWKNAGQEPPSLKRESGWAPLDRPPAEWLNWFFNKTYESLKELQEHSVPDSTFNNIVGTSLNLPEWLQTSLYEVAKLHDNYLRQVGLNIKQPPYNVRGGGIEDTEAIQRAFDDAAAKNIGCIIFPYDSYKILNTIKIKKQITVLGNESEILWANETNVINKVTPITENWNGMFTIMGELLTTSTPINAYQTTISNNVECGRFTVTDASQFSKNDFIAISIPRQIQSYSEYKPCIEIMAQIIEIDAVNNYIYTDYFSPFDFSNFAFSSSHVIQKINPVKHVSIKDFYLNDIVPWKNPSTINNGSNRDKIVCGIGIQYAADVALTNISGKNTKFPVITTYYAHTVNINKIKIVDPAYLGGGEGYGIQVNNGYNVHINGITGIKERHLVDFSASGFCSLRNAISTSVQVGSYDCHGICEHDILFDNCVGSFQFGNGIQYFPELTDRITIRNSKGSIVANSVGDLNIETSRLRIQKLTVNGDLTFDQSRLEMFGTSEISYLERGGRSKAASLKVTDSKMITGDKRTTWAGAARFGGFEVLIVDATEIDFSDAPLVISLYNIKRMTIENVTRKNTFFFLETDKPLKIDYALNHVTTTFDASIPLYTYYKTVDRLDTLKQATGTVSINDVRLFDANTGSQVWTILDVSNDAGTRFTGSNIRIFLRDSIYSAGRFGSLVATYKDIPEVTLYTRDNIFVDVADTDIKLSTNRLIPLKDLQLKYVTYENGWTDWNTSLYKASYLKDEHEFVHLSGALKGGTSSSGGTTMFTLPSGYRPKRNLLFPIITLDAANNANLKDVIMIGADGTVKISSNDASGRVVLDGISFSTIF